MLTHHTNARLQQNDELAAEWTSAKCHNAAQYVQIINIRDTSEIAFRNMRFVCKICGRGRALQLRLEKEFAAMLC